MAPCSLERNPSPHSKLPRGGDSTRQDEEAWKSFNHQAQLKQENFLSCLVVSEEGQILF